MTAPGPDSGPDHGAPVRIGRRAVGTAQPVYVIAEAGVNHDGDLDRALRLVDAAARAGADAVKFQFFSADRLAARDAPACAYQERAAAALTQHDMLRRLELPAAAFRRLRDHAAAAGLDFLATPFGRPELRELLALAPPAVKIASPDIVNHPLLEEAARSGLPLIVSTGAADLDEVDAAVRLVRQARDPARLILLHCVSAYPTPPAEARLRCIATLHQRYRLPVGFSDHTAEVAIGSLAVAAGAALLEKHLTLDRAAPGPDHFFSLEPEDFARYVRGARQADATLGDGFVHPSPAEAEVRALARGSIIAARPLTAGQTLTAGDLDIQRPAGGIGPSAWKELLGRRARADIPAHTRLEWSMVDGPAPPAPHSARPSEPVGQRPSPIGR
jgi:N-acetylneuraminate synthase/N,N'-diacetyllegionaminate synthase